jgi:hypothetical protein
MEKSDQTNKTHQFQRFLSFFCFCAEASSLNLMVKNEHRFIYFYDSMM